MRLEHVDDSAYKCHESVECWDNRLTLHGKSLIEQHIKSGLTVVLNADLAGGRYGFQDFPRSTDAKRHSPELITSVVLKIHSGQSCYLDEWEDEPVLVRVVQFVKGQEGVIPSLVGLYDVHNKIADKGIGLM